MLPLWQAAPGRCSFSFFPPPSCPCGGDCYRGLLGRVGRAWAEGGGAYLKQLIDPSFTLPPLTRLCSRIVPVDRCALCLRDPPALCCVSSRPLCARGVAQCFPLPGHPCDTIFLFPLVVCWFALYFRREGTCVPRGWRRGGGGGLGGRAAGVSTAAGLVPPHPRAQGGVATAVARGHGARVGGRWDRRGGLPGVSACARAVGCARHGWRKTASALLRSGSGRHGGG